MIALVSGPQTPYEAWGIFVMISLFGIWLTVYVVARFLVLRNSSEACIKGWIKAGFVLVAAWMAFVFWLAHRLNVW